MIVMGLKELYVHVHACHSDLISGHLGIKRRLTKEVIELVGNMRSILMYGYTLLLIFRYHPVKFVK